MRVAEPELAAVQRRDRRGEAQPETRTRQCAACLEPDELLPIFQGAYDNSVVALKAKFEG